MNLLNPITVRQRASANIHYRSLWAGIYTKYDSVSSVLDDTIHPMFV
ncbi:hypothetical protein X975_15290, partial [Stegodyphus mimosarum]